MKKSLNVLGLSELVRKAKRNGCIVVVNMGTMSISPPHRTGIKTLGILGAIKHQATVENVRVRVAI